MINIQLKGVDAIISQLKEKPKKAKNQVELAIGISCSKIARDIREAINIVGEPDGVPRRRTGNLLMSIKVGKFKQEGSVMSQTVGANPDGNEEGYASWLEFGTSRMKARPFVGLITERNRENCMNQINKAIKNIC